MDKDELAARRWFRARLTEIAKAHPELVSSKAQQRLERHITDEEHVCPESRQDVRQADPKGAAS